MKAGYVKNSPDILRALFKKKKMKKHFHSEIECRKVF